MEYRRLGSSGLKISALSFGSWVTFHYQMDEKKAYDCMKAAYDSGMNFFDNAEAYAGGESERIMGKVLKKTNWKRSDLIISTKIFWGGEGPNDRGLSRKHIWEGTHAALQRLQLDYVDLLFCHRPDPETPIEETVWAMSELVRQGKALYWGTSEWPAELIMEAYRVARREHLIPPSMEQPEYNMFERKKVELDYLPLYREIGLGTTIWSPLACGLLTGKYNNGVPEDSRLSLRSYQGLKEQILNEEGLRRIEKVKQLVPLAHELGFTMAQMALAWCLNNPHVSSVITGASRPEQVLENAKAVAMRSRLNPDVMRRIDEILQTKPVAAER